jgi:hypothetical protein
MPVGTEAPVQFKRFIKHQCHVIWVFLVDIALLGLFCLKKEWRLLRNGVLTQAKVISLDNGDHDNERYHIEYHDQQNAGLVGSFLNYTPMAPNPRNFKPRHKPGDNVLIVIDPYNPKKFVEWTGRYENG